MQDLSALSKADLELVKIASEHAKQRYEKDFISIAGALRTKSGKVYTGINLKYRTRNVSTCGGTTAIYNALNNGERAFDTIVEVKYLADTDSFEVVNGCGWCRQLFSYNAPLNIIVDQNGKLGIMTAEEMLPYAFL